MKASDLLFEFYDPSNDRSIKAELSDTRRTRLTIRHIHKIRKMRDIEAEDRRRHLLLIKQVYGASPEGGEPQF